MRCARPGGDALGLLRFFILRKVNVPLPCSLAALVDLRFHPRHLPSIGRNRDLFVGLNKKQASERILLSFRRRYWPRAGARRCRFLPERGTSTKDNSGEPREHFANAAHDEPPTPRCFGKPRYLVSLPFATFPLPVDRR